MRNPGSHVAVKTGHNFKNSKITGGLQDVSREILRADRASKDYKCFKVHIQFLC